jgi:hypothetical protein
MNRKIERFFLALILAPPTPLALFLAGWWGAFQFLPEEWIPFVAISGLLLGILIDIFILRRLIDRVDHLSIVFWSAVYLFYSMGAFGFFMGVPVFNSFLSLPAGFVVGRKLAAEKADLLRVRRAARRTAWFSTGILAVVCVASATVALLSNSTASDLQHMLGLWFEVTPGMILGLIVIGGLALLALGWGLAVVSVRFSFTFFQRST